MLNQIITSSKKLFILLDSPLSFLFSLNIFRSTIQGVTCHPFPQHKDRGYPTLTYPPYESQLKNNYHQNQSLSRHVPDPICHDLNQISIIQLSEGQIRSFYRESKRRETMRGPSLVIHCNKGSCMCFHMLNTCKMILNITI